MIIFVLLARPIAEAQSERVIYARSMVVKMKLTALAAAFLLVLTSQSQAQNAPIDMQTYGCAEYIGNVDTLVAVAADPAPMTPEQWRLSNEVAYVIGFVDGYISKIVKTEFRRDITSDELQEFHSLINQGCTEMPEKLVINLLQGVTSVLEVPLIKQD